MLSLGPGVFGGPAAGDLLVGAAEGDDAAVLRLDDERALVLTTASVFDANNANPFGRVISLQASKKF